MKKDATEPTVEELAREWVRGDIDADVYFAAIRKLAAEQSEREAERAVRRSSGTGHSARHAASAL